ncbi:MAG: hypothetical protein PHD81_04045 [Candidatus Nanoarchaeia archaeon]|nr:hypothetical protein [Candidatus Nanoarchaeia archaeon]MDD5588253.1 hypothetical protein [Candidatus Nanoarchaeia archaeon]
METIKILPHHIGHYFEVYFLKRNPEEGNSWYDDEKAKQNGEKAIKTVVLNPSQLISLVSKYDNFCKMCPRNKNGENFVQPENTCVLYENPDFNHELNHAKFLGIDDILDKEPVTAETLFKKLEPIYKRIFTEQSNPHSSTKSPREYFRVSGSELTLLDF